MPQLIYEPVDPEGLSRLASALAARLQPGDVMALWGDPGAGKTDFVRFFIEAEGAADGVVLMQRPEGLGNLPADRLDVRFQETASPGFRRIALDGAGKWTQRLERFAAWRSFIDQAGWGGAKPVHTAGDASVRSYVRLRRSGGPDEARGPAAALLMDWRGQPDGPPVRRGLPYSQIAHLAEDVRPFVAVAHALREAGLAAPEIYAQDLEHGFLLLEDFGDAVFTRDGVRKDQYRAAVDVLLRLRARPPARALTFGEGVHILPAYDREALAMETELLLDWFLPAVADGAPSASSREAFIGLWSAQFDWLLTQPAGWVLRDFHSPNLIWRAGEQGLARVGLIDFQDAVLGHPAYDLVSLLQDARQDVGPEVEAELFRGYCDGAAGAEPGFDRAAFARAYAILGAQRNTKILGIFARLARRDGKRAYLRHIPRIAGYLDRNLNHPCLSGLKAWRHQELPDDIASVATAI